MTACSASDWSLTTPVLFTAAVCLGVLLLMLRVARQRDFPGRASYLVLHLGSLWWMLAASLEMSLQAPPCKIFWASMAWPGILITPTFWAVFLWQYLNSVRHPLSWRATALLLIAPLAFWALALGNPGGQFYGPGSAPLDGLYGAPIRYEHGPLFYASAFYLYPFMLFCLAVALRAAWHSRGLFRRHYLVFASLTLVPWIANISYVGFDWMLFGFDPTPFSFAFTLLAFSWLIGGGRLFDLLPVARHLLLEELPDPVLVVDAQGQVMEANPAALRLSGVNRGGMPRHLAEWPVIGTQLVAALAKEPGAAEEQVLSLGERDFELRLRPILRGRSGQQKALGQMLYLRDVTRHRRSERQLVEALALSEARLHTISELHEQLRQQALHDPLTGLYNRRYLDEFFQREAARALREQAPIAVVMLDLDHFKVLNDTYGHPVGDEVLCNLAKFLKGRLRESDAVFRLGGEEFLLILPAVAADEALALVSRIGQELAEQPLPSRCGPLSITFSAGLVEYPRQAASLDQLLALADQALYRAKHAGRNRVCPVA